MVDKEAQLILKELFDLEQLGWAQEKQHPQHYLVFNQLVLLSILLQTCQKRSQDIIFLNSKLEEFQPAMFHTLLQIACDCCDLQFNYVNQCVRQEAVDYLQSMLANGFNKDKAEQEIVQMIRYSKDDFNHLKYVLEIVRERPD